MFNQPGGHRHVTAALAGGGVALASSLSWRKGADPDAFLQLSVMLRGSCQLLLFYRSLVTAALPRTGSASLSGPLSSAGRTRHLSCSHSYALPWFLEAAQSPLYPTHLLAGPPDFSIGQNREIKSKETASKDFGRDSAGSQSLIPPAFPP